MQQTLIKERIYIFIVSCLLFLGFNVIFFHIGPLSSNMLTNYVMLISTIYILIIYIKTMINFKKENMFNNIFFDLANFLIYTPLLFLTNLISIYSIIYIFNFKNYIIIEYALMILIIQLLIYIPMYILFYKEEINKQANIFLGNFPKYIWYITIFYIIVTLLGGLSNEIFVASTNLETGNDNQEVINNIIQANPNNIFYIFSAIIISPIIEEFIYRYILIERVILRGLKLGLLPFTDFWYSDINVKRKIYDLCIILLLSFIAGMIFAFAHAMAAQTFPIFIRDLISYSGFAIGISFTYIYTRNIFVTIPIHIITNALAIAYIVSTTHK